MAFRISSRSVAVLEPQAKPYIAFDTDLKGFGVRVYPSGARSFVVEYRPGAGDRDTPKRRIKIGAVGELTVEQARKAARDLLARVRLGADPAAERAAARGQATVSDLAEAFFADVRAKRKARTLACYEGLLRKHFLPRFGTRKVDALTRPALARFHTDLADRPYAANRVIAIVSAMLGYAAAHHLVPEGFNPARGIGRFPEKAREKFLSAAELDRLGAALREAETTGLPWRLTAAGSTAKHTPKAERRFSRLSPHAVAAVRLLLFTGCRLREILNLRWSEVDLERGFLFLPDSKTGRKTIVLNAPAMAVLAGLPRIGEYVIAGETAGTGEDRPRADLKRPWAAIAARAGLSGVRIHDLRHTHASFGAAGGLGLPVIGKLLGHRQAATTARYAHLDVDPLRRASEHIGARLADALGEALRKGRARGQVVPLRKRK